MELFKIMSDILQNKYNYNQIKVEQKNTQNKIYNYQT